MKVIDLMKVIDFQKSEGMKVIDFHLLQTSDCIQTFSEGLVLTLIIITVLSLSISVRP